MKESYQFNKIQGYSQSVVLQWEGGGVEVSDCKIYIEKRKKKIRFLRHKELYHGRKNYTQWH